MHELHHSSIEIDCFSENRTHLYEAFIGTLLPLFIYILLGADIRIVLIFQIVDNLFGLWHHSNIRLKIGFLQYIIISPEMHRCHHLNDLKYQKSNYGNILSIYDWIFGTAYYPVEQEYQHIAYGTEIGYPQNFIKQNIRVLQNIKGIIINRIAGA